MPKKPNCKRSIEDLLVGQKGAIALTRSGESEKEIGGRVAFRRAGHIIQKFKCPSPRKKMYRRELGCAAERVWTYTQIINDRINYMTESSSQKAPPTITRSSNPRKKRD